MCIRDRGWSPEAASRLVRDKSLSRGRSGPVRQRIPDGKEGSAPSTPFSTLYQAALSHAASQPEVLQPFDKPLHMLQSRPQSRSLNPVAAHRQVGSAVVEGMAFLRQLSQRPNPILQISAHVTAQNPVSYTHLFFHGTIIRKKSVPGQCLASCFTVTNVTISPFLLPPGFFPC